MLLPVQIGPLDGPEVFLAFVLAGLVAGSWVYLDATKREDENALLWAAVVAFLFLFYFIFGFAALVIYVVLRGRAGEESASSTPESTESIASQRASIDEQSTDTHHSAGESGDRDRSDRESTDRYVPAEESADRGRPADESANRESGDR